MKKTVPCPAWANRNRRSGLSSSDRGFPPEFRKGGKRKNPSGAGNRRGRISYIATDRGRLKKKKKKKRGKHDLHGIGGSQ